MSTLVKELIDSGIEVIETLNSNGYICSITAGRLRGCSVTPKDLGIKNFEGTEETDNFISKYVSNSHISFLGKERDSKLDSIVSRCRNDLYSQNEYYFSRNAKDKKKPVTSVFLYKGQYEDFKKLFFQRRREYFEEASVNLAIWDTIKTDFESSLKFMLNTANKEKADEVYSKIMSKFPTKEEYEKSLKFSFIPMPVVVKITDKDLSEFEDDLVESGIEQAIKPLLFSLFNVCEKVCFEMNDKGKISEPTKKNFIKIAKRASENNFCKLPIFDIEVDKISLIDDELILTAEEMGINTFEYCKKIDLDSELDKGCLAACLS